ncbi:OmpH family outer membrane protein [Litorisediminicola beolgyonensis]|uniref:OmpH family outer membrane protein n=1 Tax=Litorisediminicola beolgyonensis TaxID=1173614 RepID=A0ABW3ZFG5_9RHOB
MRMRIALAAALLALALPGHAGAQQQPAPIAPGPSAILTIEPDRFYAESAFGARVSREIEAEGQAIAAENRRIEADLTEEERRLTEERDRVPADEFRALADAFDEKVQSLRQTQDAKARALGTRSEEERRRFLDAAQPVLTRLLADRGAAMILDRRSVFFSLATTDVTDAAIARVNAAFGDGSALPEN